MQDDCYVIASDGWREAAQPRLIVEDKNKKTKTRPDFVLGKKKYQAELIPPALIVRRWFAEEQAAIEKLEAEVATLEQQIEEIAEEQGGWGSCSATARPIRLNSALAKKPRECLEYIVVHEMVHLLERTHNRRFMSLMEKFMPHWQSHRELLNRLPVRREKWVY
jgi:predicted metal-dependent hydrolase